MCGPSVKSVSWRALWCSFRSQIIFCVRSCLSCKLPAGNLRWRSNWIPWTSLAQIVHWIIAYCLHWIVDSLAPLWSLLTKPASPGSPCQQEREEKRREIFGLNLVKTAHGLMPTCLLEGVKKIQLECVGCFRNARGRLASCARDGMCLVSLSPDIVSGPW